MISFYVLITSFLIGFLVLPILIKFLRKIQFGDIPGGRKIHNQFTPSMGGIAILSSFFFSLAIWGIVDGRINDIWFLMAGIGIVFLVGLSDDIVDLRATTSWVVKSSLHLLSLISGKCVLTPSMGF